MLASRRVLPAAKCRAPYFARAQLLHAAASRPLKPPLHLCLLKDSMAELNTENDNVASAHGPTPAMRSVMVVVKEVVWERPDAGIVTALQQAFPDTYTTPTGAKRACRRKEVYLDGVPVNTTATLLTGQRLQIMARGKASDIPEVKPELALPPLDVLYEDDHLAVVYKPAGLPTQGPGGDSAHARMKFCLKPSQVPGALHRPQHVHRLDAPTCGLLVGAKTRVVCTRMMNAFKGREVKKRYLAIVKGKLEEGAKGIIDQPLKGKTAVTEYEVLRVDPSVSFGWLSTLSLRPHTGRKHQLRRHCAEVVGCHILGETRHVATSGRAVAAAVAGGAAKRQREEVVGAVGAEETSKVDPAAGASGPGAEVAAGTGEGGTVAVAAVAAVTPGTGMLAAVAAVAEAGEGAAAGLVASAAGDSSAPSSQHVMSLQQPAGPGADHPQQHAQPDVGTEQVVLGSLEDMDEEEDGCDSSDEDDTIMRQEGGDLNQGQEAGGMQKSKGEAAEDGAPTAETAVAAGSEAGASSKQNGYYRPRGGAGGGRRRDVLADGKVADLCLCAAEIQFVHPVTQQPMRFRITSAEPPYFGHVRQIEAPAAP